ncbi:MAG: hydrogenase [Candidatus Omnitrophica bacterium]|nr:hydrogenase [Candidatus Omnitrophota bacterium]
MLALLIIIPFISALAMFLPVRKIFRLKLLCGVSLLHLIITASFWRTLPASEFNGYLVLDALGLILLSINSVLFLAVSVFMLGYFQHEQRRNKVLTACLCFLLSTITLVSVSYHLGLLWVAVETTTLFSAPLISFHRNQQTLEATWKYLLVCSVGIALALMGTFFMAIAAHNVQTLSLPVILSNAALLSKDWLKISVIFLFVGYGCKMGLAPTHTWKPEAYGQATGMVVVLMAGGLTQCSFLALARVAQICSKAGITDFYSSILIFSGVLSLAVPALFILGERSLKRAFAFSSIEHMGLLVLGLGLGGIGIFGALFHMINNAIAKIIMFLTAGSIAQKYGSSRIEDVRGIIRYYPVTGIFLILAFFAGTGMFPFATFHSELMILNSAVSTQHWIIVGVGLAAICVMFIGTGRIVLDMVYGPTTEPVLEKKENFFMNVSILAGIVVLMIIGLWMPAHLEKVIRAAALLVAGKG